MIATRTADSLDQRSVQAQPVLERGLLLVETVKEFVGELEHDDLAHNPVPISPGKQSEECGRFDIDPLMTDLCERDPPARGVLDRFCAAMPVSDLGSSNRHETAPVS